MNQRFKTHLFWGSHSPFALFTGTALIILASSRLVFALVSSAALIWVYGLTSLVFLNARKFMPVNGKMIILLFLSTFFCGMYLLFLGFLNPLLTLGIFPFLMLIAPCCLGTNFYEASDSIIPLDGFFRSLLEAMVLSGIILALALIREPLGMGTLSFPGGPQGIIELSFGNDAFVPVRLFSVSGGGILLFGYGVAVYRHFKERNGRMPGEQL